MRTVSTEAITQSWEKVQYEVDLCLSKVQLFGHYCGPNSKVDRIVRDPYYGYYIPINLANGRGTSGFEDNFKQLTLFSEEFLRQVLGVKI